MQWVVYLLRCSDGSFYCGATNRLKHRVQAHNDGAGARYTRSRRPVHLVWHQPCESKSAALAMEWHIKQLTRQQKCKLIEESNSLPHVRMKFPPNRQM